MAAAFTMLLAKISALLGWFAECFTQVFKDLWEWITDLVCWAFDKFLGLAQSMISALDFSPIEQWTSMWGQLPANVLEVLAAIGLGTAFGIIVAAIVIRLLLQLIPFTRLGS